MLRKRLLRVHAQCDALANRTRIPGRLKLAEWYANFALPACSTPVACPTVYNFDLLLDESTSRAVYRLDFYESGTLDVMRRFLRPGDVFVDAGASVGLMSLFASQLVGNDGCVLSFEPLPKRFEQLSASIAMNGRQNVRPFPIGLGATARQLSIFTDRVSPSMVATEDSTKSEDARVERLDTMLERQGLSTVRMIKIDVEGFELEVLQGCDGVLRGPNPPVLCVEYGMYESQATALEEYLRSLPQYDVFQLSETKKYASELRLIPAGARLRSADNVFCVPRALAP